MAELNRLALKNNMSGPKSGEKHAKNMLKAARFSIFLEISRPKWPEKAHRSGETEVRDQGGGLFGPGSRAEGGVRHQRGQDGRQLGDFAELPLGSAWFEMNSSEFKDVLKAFK